MEQNINNDEIEIDLILICRVVLAKIWYVLLAGALCGVIGFLVASFVMPEKYVSKAQLYIINRQNEGTTTYTDLQTSTQLVKDYQVLVVSRPVVEQVISNLGLDVSTTDFVSDVSVNIASDSRVLALSVTNRDPYMAKKIVDNLADVSSKRICSVMQIDGVNIIEYGNIPTAPTSPDIMKITLLGVIAGMFVAIAVIIIVYLLDDSVKTSDDIEHYLGISTLALIPLAAEEYDGKGTVKKKKKKVARR